MSICVIPARGQSRRIPRKNIKPFFGKPLICYSIEAAQQSGVFDRIVVSTDDEEIGKIAGAAGAEILERPAHLAVDAVGTQEVMRHAVALLGVRGGRMVCCQYAPLPLLEPSDLHSANAMFSEGYVVAVGANPLRDIGWFYFGLAHSFLNGEPLYTSETRLYVVENERAIDINVEADFQMAELAYAKLRRAA